MAVHTKGIILAPLLACVLFLCSCGQRGAEITTGQTSAESGTLAAQETASGDNKISGTDVSGDDVTQLTQPELERIGDFINQDSSYGFLLSFYDSVKDADLRSVFYKIGSPANEDEKKAYLEAVGRGQLKGNLIKITQDEADRILKARTGLGTSDFSQYSGWTYLESAKAYFFEMGSSQRPYFEVLDGYESGDKLIVHCRRDSYQDVSSMYSMEGNSAGTAETEASAADTAASAANTGSAADSADSAAGSTGSATEAAAQEEPGSTGSTEIGWHRDVFEVTLTRATPFEPDTSRMAATAAEASGSEQTAAPAEEPSQTESYGFRPEEYGNAYRFVSNDLYIQSGMLEQHSETFALNRTGDADFISYGTDSGSPDHADVTFEIMQSGAVRQVLPGVTEDNIREGLTFTRIDSVDIEDFDGDGRVDIAVICTYRKDGGGSRREARLYRSAADGTFSLDTETTKKVNTDVKSLSYSSVSAYLRGKSDGSVQTYSSWKEAYADQLSILNADLWQGAELIYVNEDRTPELLIYGKEDAQGVTLMTYSDGKVHDLHLQRRGVTWLESENVLLNSSSFMDRHYDVVYSMSDGALTATASGYYGSTYGLHPVEDAKGNPEYEYDWAGADLSKDGYREAMMFSFDFYREKTVSGEDLSTVEDLIKELEK